MTPTLITAFEIHSAESAHRIEGYIRLLQRHAPEHTFALGVSGDPDVVGLVSGSAVRRFPAGTSRAQMMNIIISECEAQDLLLCDGPMLPIADSPGDESSAAGAVPDLGHWAPLSAREILLPPELTPEDLEDADPSRLVFTQSRGEDSPAAIRLTRDRVMHIRGFDERRALSDILFADLFHRLWRLGDAPMRRWTSSGSPLMIDIGAVWADLASPAIGAPIAVRRKRTERIAAESTLYRNLVQWSVLPEHRPVLVSVAIATRNRGPYLLDSIRSVQAQDFQEFQLVIVDDGSEDHTESVVRSVDDPRILYIKTEPRGISHARNVAADVSTGYFTAVHDDDDMMLTWRITACLNALDGEHRAAYGSWINFDNETAEMALHITKRGFGRDLIAYSNQTPGHSTWLLPTRCIRTLRYDESYSSSVDHNLAVRTLLAGLTWKHTERVLFLRRIHATQVSVTDSRRQLGAAQLTNLASSFASSHNGRKQATSDGKALGFPSLADRSRLFEDFGAFLPDHLVRRTAKIRGLVGKKVLAIEAHEQLTAVLTDMDLQTGRSTAELGELSDITWADMVRIRRSGLIGIAFDASHPSDVTHQVPSSADLIENRLNVLAHEVSGKESAGVLLVVDGEPSSSAFLDEAKERILLCHHLSQNTEPDHRVSKVVYGLASTAAAMRFLSWSGKGKYARWSIVQPAGQPMEAIMPAEGSTR